MSRRQCLKESSTDSPAPVGPHSAKIQWPRLVLTSWLGSPSSDSVPTAFVRTIQAIVKHSQRYGSELATSFCGFDALLSNSFSASQGLTSGIKVIDTARSYGEGEAEELIGEVLQELKSHSAFDRRSVRLISKAGYVASSELQVHSGESNELETGSAEVNSSNSDTIKPSMFKSRLESTHELMDLSHLGLGDVYHSLHPGLLQQQLDHSLDALQTDYIDSYLLHNPEHYIQYKQMLDKSDLHKTKHTSPTDSSSKDASKAPTSALPDPLTFPPFEEKLLEAFIVLEDAVAQGKIRSYGVSSNWLAYASESQELHYKDWISLSESAYRAVNQEGATLGQVVNDSRRSNLRVLQFPGNILETYGVDNVARWAKTQGLEVMVNRPLDALDTQGHQWRLATYTGVPHSVYTTLRDKTIEFFQEMASSAPKSASVDRNIKFLTTLVTDLDRELFRFQSVYHYQQDFSAQIMPMLIERMTMMQDPKALEAIQTFLAVYEMKVRQHCSVTAEEHVSSIFKDKYNSKSTRLQDFAFSQLLNNENIDIVLNGMTREAYVDEALKLLDTVKNKPKTL